MDKSKFKEAMRPFKDPAPSVGIFWVDAENEDLRNEQIVQLMFTGKEKGNLTIHNTHKSLWQKRRNQALRRKEQGLSYDSYYFQDYTQILRGRVWYSADIGKYFVAVGDWYKEYESWLRPLIADEFYISEDFEFVVDECLLDIDL